MSEKLNFDRFMAERDGETLTVRALGRDLRVKKELPWWYVMKLDRLLRDETPISGEENAALLRQMLDADDYDYLTTHPEFRGSWFWELIAFIWLRGDGEAAAFTTEDDQKAAASKKGGSARRNSGRSSRLTSSASTASTCSKAT